MDRWTRLAPLLAALPLLSCVSIEEGPVPPDAVVRGQRVVLAVHAAPGPLIDETDTKVETAAKILPGLGLVVQSAQEERLLEAARGLAVYLTDWAPERRFYDALLEAFAQQGGGPLAPAEAGVSTQTFRAMNAAKDQIEWRRLYFWDHPDHARRRDYSKELSLDDALILEANLTYGLALDAEGGGVPTLSASLRLVKVNSMRRLWRREETVDDKAAVKSLYEFKTLPEELTASWKKLLPVLAAQAAASYRQAVPRASAPASPEDFRRRLEGSLPPGVILPSSAPVSGLPPEQPVSLSSATVEGGPR